MQKHEKLSAQFLASDKKLKNFFSKEEITIMKEAIEVHRASTKEEPRNIYGKIISSADRSTSLYDMLKRTYEYIKNHNKNLNMNQIIDESYEHIKNKFGKNGYAKNKMCFKDEEYEIFLKKIEIILSNRKNFEKEYENYRSIKTKLIK